MRSLPGRVILVVGSSLSSLEVYHATPFWLVESAVNLMGVPLYVVCHFSLAAFNNFSLSLIFASLITMCLGVFLLGFILYGTLCFLDLGGCFLSHVREVFDYNPSYIFSGPFSLSSPSGTDVDVVAFNVVPEVS